MATSVSHSPRFVPSTGESWRSPWAMYDALRENDPVHNVVPEASPQDDYWVLTRHEDVYNAARDYETYSSAKGLTTVYGELEQIGMQDNPPFVMQDPPVQSEFRRMVSKGFTPRQVSAVEPMVRDFVVERIEALKARGSGDIVVELFKPLPSMVVAHYLGVPEADRDQFDGWTEAIVAANSAGGVAAAATTAQAATGELMMYFASLIERRKVEPGDDTISHLLAAGLGEDGDMSGLLSILGFAFTMVAGGNDTTTGMLGGSVAMLTERLDQRQILLDDPALITDAVEELLRLTSPVQGLARTTTRDVALGGKVIPAGRKVLLMYGAANRDPEKYGPDAAELNVVRRPQKILTFSHGAHHCLGASAARMQARVALEELLSRIPDFHVDIEAMQYAPGNYVRRPLSAPMSVTRP
ncbi:cytochrome P450 [Rhodococcus qingshengii]|uniref:cytochrome P450 n=1 Tax=Rhodococcus qingshengii TaxID=334542 RepID=UPI0036DA4E77